jgi:hypothetical protein
MNSIIESPHQARDRHNQASITERKKKAISQILITGIGNTPIWKEITTLPCMPKLKKLN